VVSNNKNINPIFLGVVLNAVDKRRASFKNFYSELRLILGDKLFETSISLLTEVADAPFYGETSFEHNPNGIAQKQVTLLVEEIERRIKDYI
jgi:cellulose biosynthesis protein BcsQ